MYHLLYNYPNYVSMCLINYIHYTCTMIRTATFDDKFNYLEDFKMQETAQVLLSKGQNTMTDV